MAPKLPQGNFASLPIGAKIFVLVALLTVLSCGYYFGIHLGVEEETEGAVSAHAALERDLQGAHQRQQAFLKLREEVANREAMDRQNLRVLPEKAEIAAFLDDLNRLAELSGLQMGTVSPQPELSEKFYVRVPVQLAVTGKYHQIAKFFYNISRLERAINMENVSIAISSHTGDEMTLAIQVLATTFRRLGSSETVAKVANKAVKKGGH